MPAIPITKGLSWRNPPVVTLVLILLNVLVFTVVQHGDDERSQAAESYYFESGLDKIEFPVYDAYLQQKGQRPDRDSASHLPPETLRRYTYYALNSDGAFLKTLADHHKTDPTTYDRWHRLRTEFEALRDRVVTLRHGFRPAAPRISTWFTSLFLHANWEHLIGNMVFLWLVGASIELGCRHWGFLLIYLIGGVMANGFFMLCNLNSLVPTIGASGAISGIMGAFCILYGRRKVRFFITLGFYFNYLKFPALIMLPLWVGEQIAQMLLSPGSPVAYTAHLGGLIGGAALTKGLCYIPNLFKTDAFDDARTDPVDGMVEAALTHMGALDFPKARELLTAALELRPNDTAVLTHLFHIDQLEPDQPLFHRTATALLACLTQSEKTYEQAYQTYTEYLAATCKAKLSPALYARLSQVLSSLGQPAEARKLISVLLKHCPDQPMLPTALLKLARAHARAGETAAQKSCLAFIRKRYPHSSEARLIETAGDAACKA
jgi:membrane associated rhomboid family serine protease